MPGIDNYLLDNYRLDGFPKTVEAISITPSILGAGSTWQSGINGVGTIITMVPAGTRIISIAPLSNSARLSVGYSGGGNVQITLGLEDAKGVVWFLNNSSATDGVPNISHSHVIVKTDGSALAGWVVGNYNPSSSDWQQSFVSKPAAFDPDAGPMKLGLSIRGNFGTAFGSLYMQNFRVDTA